MTTPSRFPRRFSLGRSFGSAAILALIFISSVVHPVVAQGIRLGREDYGVRGRVGYLGGETVGRTDSLAHLEIMPYLRTPNGALLGNVRFFGSDGDLGANFGIGYRQLLPDIDRIFGGIIWYDYDQLNGDDTQQITLSFETYGSRIDTLANIYIPLGDEQIGSLSASNSRFVGDELLFDQSGTLGDVLGGGDVQVGMLLPGSFANEYQIRAFAGAYHYTGTAVEDITGVLGRLEGSIFGMLDGQVKVTSDNTFGTNVLFGVSVGVTRARRGNQWRSQPQDQITRYPTRQYNAVVVNTDVTRTGVAAVSPDTGQAFSFTHIASGATGVGDGTAENPFSSLQAGLAQNTDFHIVEAGSIFTGDDAAVSLSDGDRLIGLSGGLQQELQARGVGSLVLPSAPVGSAAPILRGTVGDSVLLADNSEFRGFSIEDSGGNGIVFDGVDNALISDVSVLSAAVNGVLAEDISGSVSILNTTVSSSGAAALRLDNVTGAVTVSGEFENDSGEALVLNGIGADADIDLADATFANDTGSGLSFTDVDGAVALAAVSLTNSTGNGINVDGGSGTIRFVGDTVIEGATGDAVRLHNSDATVEFDTLTIRDANGVGISVFNNANTASLVVSGHTLIDGVTDGIRIQDNLGSLQFESLEIDGRLNHGILIDNNDGQFVANGDVSIGNTQGATDSAIELSNSASDFGFGGAVSITDATGDSAVQLQDNTGITTFASLDIAAVDGAGFTARDTTAIQILDGNVSTENGAAFDIEEAAITIDLDSVSVTGGDYGIRVSDSTGSFIVGGTGTDDSGGFINDTTTGILLENAGTIAVRNLTLDGNSTGISADTVEQLVFWTGSITGSNTATDLVDVRFIDFISSSFSDNTTTFDWLATTNDTYSWLLDQVVVDSGNNRALLARGTGGADLTVNIQSSEFTTSASNTNVIDIQGDSLFDVVMSNNQVDSLGSNVTLVDISSNSQTELGRFTLFNNRFSSTGSSTTAIRTTTAGPSELLVEQNSIDFGGDRGLGIAFNLAGSATVGLYTNLIEDQFDGATAVLFESITGPSRIEIGGNALDFTNLGGLSDRGFIFESITGDVTLFGVTDNVVNGASTSVFVPSGRTTGSFLVNGFQVP